MPVYNERQTVSTVIDSVLSLSIPLEKEVIVVDDGSCDGTQEVLSQMEFTNVRVVLQEKNRGKGAALRRGFQEASGDIVIIQDADLEYNPTDYLKILQPILNGQADVVYGSRFLGGPHRALLFWHYIGNRFLTFLSNLLNNLNLTDMETGYKAFKIETIKNLPLKCDRFGFEPEITAKLAKRRYKIYEVPISYSGRDYSEGKKITWWDGLKAIFVIVWFRFFD